MSPLDDELRRALHSRADVLLPAPDPLAGLESRARGLRRRRAAAALAGSVLAVTAVAVAVSVAVLQSGGSAPARVATVSPTTPAPVRAAPTNVLSWPARGSIELMSPASQIRVAVAHALGADESDVEYTPLYTGQAGSLGYTIGQAWRTGDALAHTFGMVSGGGEVFLGPLTDPRAHLVALDLSNLPRRSTELLVVVPEPRTTQVLYDTDGTGAFAPASADGEGIVRIDRAASTAGAATDRLQLLTGNGDPATDVTFQGAVASLLCGASGCG